MSWRTSQALESLRREVNAAHPGRSKISDGTIGDAAHSSRTSDHNPNEDGIVMAWDVTKGPDNIAQKVIDFLIASRDDRIKYLIWERQIMSGNGGPRPWVWRPYKGSNPHDRHAHISFRSDDPAPWGYPASKPTPPAARPPDPEEIDMATAKELRAEMNRLDEAQRADSWKLFEINYKRTTLLRDAVTLIRNGDVAAADAKFAEMQTEVADLQAQLDAIRMNAPDLPDEA
jgi:hypothetical protein